MTTHAKRLLVAIVAIPVFFGCIWLGGWWFFGLVAVLTVIGIHEMNSLSVKKGASPQEWLSSGVAMLICVLFYTGNQFLLPTLLVATILAILVLEMFRVTGSASLNVGATMWSIGYVALPMACLLLLRNGPYPNPDSGVQLICLVLGSIWACDSLAYYSGKMFGRHKLFERVSPRKTWEGAIGGLVGGIAGVLLIRYFFLEADQSFILNSNQTVVVGIIGGTLGQLGDLAESWLKRDAGVKDSSSIIPGHGGVLDRFDSLLFVAPATYVYVNHFIL